MRGSFGLTSLGYRFLAALVLTVPGATVYGQGFDVSIVLDGLNRPTGITVRGENRIFYTEVPTVGVFGDNGGMNTVKVHNLLRGRTITLSTGEPYPINIATGPDGTVYWTCKTAGVILARPPSGEVSMLLTDLVQPSGLAVGRTGDIYFTQLPTPGLFGDEGGTNTVDVYDGTTTNVLSMGEPEPTDVAVSAQGDVYWTCKAAGVILKYSAAGEKSMLLTGLNQPTGIALDRRRNALYFTEVPTPGVPGSMGGGNFVWKVDLETLARTIVHFGNPEPTDVAVATNGYVYWTCSSAGVIMQAIPQNMNGTNGE